MKSVLDGMSAITNQIFHLLCIRDAPRSPPPHSIRQLIPFAVNIKLSLIGMQFGFEWKKIPTQSREITEVFLYEISSCCWGGFF